MEAVQSTGQDSSTSSGSSVKFGVATGTNAYSVTTTPSFIPADGDVINVFIDNTNTEHSPTLNVNGSGAVLFKKANGWNLDAFELIDGGIYQATYYSGNWIVSDIAQVILKPSSDQTTTSISVAGTDGDVAGLAYPVQANAVYRFYGIIRIGCSSTGGVNPVVAIPAGATIMMNFIGTTTVNTASISLNAIASATIMATPYCAEATGPRFVRIDGDITIGGNAGTVQFKIASEVNGQTSTIYKESSNIIVKRIS